MNNPFRWWYECDFVEKILLIVVILVIVIGVFGIIKKADTRNIMEQQMAAKGCKVVGNVSSTLFYVQCAETGDNIVIRQVSSQK